MTPQQRREIRDLGLVAAGAIPGALLRWRLETIAQTLVGGLSSLMAADLLANMLGCLLIGLVLANGQGRPRLALAAGIGFCGSLTTFSSWMLELARALRSGHGAAAVQVLLASLIAGVLLVFLGYGLGQTLQRRRLG
ncbi:MAG: CrcB family protein [Cyanobacteriota bacterium]|nr:CrcB family protein [Cyanobacteriota bacterium]